MPETGKKRVVMVIPTYNEAANITKTITDLQRVFSKIGKKYRLEILIVDDTSPDGTAEIVRKIQKKHKNVHLLLNRQKAGLGAAYLRGLNYAYGELGAEVTFEFDADGQHQPKHIPAFLKKIDQGYDLVLGSRYIKGGSIPKTWGPHRVFLSSVGNVVVRLVMMNFRIRDWTTGYRAISKRSFLKTEKIMRENKGFSGYTWHIGQLYNTIMAGFRVCEVPIQFIDRTGGESKLGFEYIKNTLVFILKMRLLSLWKMGGHFIDSMEV